MAGGTASGVPSACTVCGTALPAGSARCPGCGRVFGEDNRCPSCSAFAPVLPRGAGFVCAACSAPRPRLPGTVVLGDGAGPGGALAPAGVASALLTVAGVAAVAGGVLLGALGAALLPGVAGWIVGALLGASGAALGVLLLRLGGRARGRALAEHREAGERRIVALAEKHGGVLTASLLAQELALSVAAADAALTAMADGTRVTVEVTADGLVEYHFRELQLASLPKVRVASDALEHELEAEGDEARSKLER